MDRATVYTQEQGRSVDFLFAQRATMIGLGKLAQATFGSSTVVRGLGVTPNSPAALNVLVNLGEIYTVAAVDATPWGALPADTTDMIVKQGLNMAVQTISTPAPTTGGFSINYLIEAQYQDQDNVPVVLPFYNSANPSQPLNGQGGGGAAQATERQGVCVIQAKAGIAAATGTQTTPAVDVGWTALAVVTVAFGQTTVVAGNISVAAGVPQISSLLQMMQTESTNYALDTSVTPNQITIALTPPITSYTDGMQLNFRAANNSSGAVNINAGPGNISLSGAAGALQSGEIVSGGYYSAVYQSNTGTAVLVGQGAGAEQVNPATQPKHAMQLGQATGRLLRTSIYTLIGGVQNVSVNGGAFTTAGATTFTPLALATTVEYEGVAGGGAGGGTVATGSTTCSVGSGGNSGQYGRGQIAASSITTVTITVGAAGAAVAGGNGGNGGSTSFGAVATMTGGLGGNASAAAAPPIIGGSQTPSTTLPVSQIAAGSSAGSPGIGLNTGTLLGGNGAASVYGGGALGGANGIGSAAIAPGAAGGGTASTISQAAKQGGAGGVGLLIVRDWA